MDIRPFLPIYRERVAALADDDGWRFFLRSTGSGMPPWARLAMASSYVGLHDIGEPDWADCIDKAVLLCARAMYLTGREADFAWRGGSRTYRWRDFLDADGRFTDESRALRKNRVRDAAQTRSAYAPTSQKHNFAFFQPDGELLHGSLYNWKRYKNAARTVSYGERPAVIDNLPPLARDPWTLPLLPGDVLVFDFRWHDSGGYSGHVPTIAYFDPDAGVLVVVEDHLPSKDHRGKSQPSETDAWLYTRDGRWTYVPGFNPSRGPCRVRGAGRFGASGIFHNPEQLSEHGAYDPEEGVLTALRPTRTADGKHVPDPRATHLLGINYAGFVGFARYTCRA
jgi:hypothetical protein